MSIRTAAQHTADALSFVCLDEAGEIAYFQSASKSNPSTPNVTAYDIDEDAAYCFCKGFECGKQCWHCDHAAAAWRTVAHKARCARMTMAELIAHGESLVKYVKDADAAGQVWLAGNFRRQLDEARVAWQEKRRAERAASAAPATVLPVLERAGIIGRAAVIALTTPTGKLLGCPDCGTPTRNPYLCTDCVNDTMAARVRQRRAELAA